METTRKISIPRKISVASTIQSEPSTLSETSTEVKLEEVEKKAKSFEMQSNQFNLPKDELPSNFIGSLKTNSSSYFSLNDQSNQGYVAKSLSTINMDPFDRQSNVNPQQGYMPKSIQSSISFKSLNNF